MQTITVELDDDFLETLRRNGVNIDDDDSLAQFLTEALTEAGWPGIVVEPVKN